MKMTILIAVCILASSFCGNPSYCLPQQSYQKDMPKSDAAIRESEKIMEAGLFQKAEGLLDRALQGNPDDVRLIIAKANLLRNAGQFSRAKELYLKAHAIAASDPAPLVALSQMSLESLAIQDSLNYARSAVQNASASMQARMTLASALIANNSLNEATITLDLLSKTYPQKAEISFLRYQLLSKENKLSEARAALEQAVKLDPTKARWLMDLSNLCKEQGDFDASLDYLKQFLKLNPSSIEALTKLALLYEYRFHDYDKSIAVYQQILDIDSDVVDALAGIGRCKQKGNDFAAALKDQLWKLIRQAQKKSSKERPMSGA
jgi:tetratricopeptide (TPR) repeat protein